MEESLGMCWRKSSYSGNGGASCVEAASDRWRKSSYSGNGGADCVEVADDQAGVVLVRDSKDREGPRLTVHSRAWSAFVQGIKHGEFDL
jgi:hypothetical protein